MSVYLHAKFEVSSIILKSFRLGSFTHPPPQNEPLKNNNLILNLQIK